RRPISGANRPSSVSQPKSSVLRPAGSESRAFFTGVRSCVRWLALTVPALLAGTIPLAISQQFNINGQPVDAKAATSRCVERNPNLGLDKSAAPDDAPR